MVPCLVGRKASFVGKNNHAYSRSEAKNPQKAAQKFQWAKVSVT